MMSDFDHKFRSHRVGINAAGDRFDAIDENALSEFLILNDGTKQPSSQNTSDNSQNEIVYQNQLPILTDFSETHEPTETKCNENVGMWEKEEDFIGYGADDEECGYKSYKQLSSTPTLEGELATLREAEIVQQTRLKTPLISILPAKYANTDVTEIFPEFRPNKVIRFSRLFNSSKSGGTWQFWQGVRRREKKRKDHDTHYSMSHSNRYSEKLKFDGWKMNYGAEPTPELIASDDDVKLLMQLKDLHSSSFKQKAKDRESADNGDMDPHAAVWRFGPAQLWYDMFNVPETGAGFDYGFKLREREGSQSCGPERSPIEEEFADEAFLLVSQVSWENKVIWNGDRVRRRVLRRLYNKQQYAGWVPSGGSKTIEAFIQLKKRKSVPVTTNTHQTTSQISIPDSPKTTQEKSNEKQPGKDIYDDPVYSIFPSENEELIYGLWEEEVIWDAQNMKKIPKPQILTLDLNDENIVLGIPEEIDTTINHEKNNPTEKARSISRPHLKKSKLLLGKAGLINIFEEDAPPLSPTPSDCDPFNISNDIYYIPRSTERTLKLNFIPHSTPVMELKVPFIPTYMSTMRRRNFHRPPIKPFSYGPLARPGPHAVMPLRAYKKKKEEQREQERVVSGGGNVFFMRTAEDLSGKDGELILVEFSEEHPPLMNQVGMCSVVKNYYKREVGKHEGPKEFKYGEAVQAHKGPFLGIITPGQNIQAIENNMYSAPIYEHSIPQTDFLVIRTRQQYFIREFDALFVAGQECPLFLVPAPNSKGATNFIKHFILVFIYRLFWKSQDTPRRIVMNDIKKAFPLHHETYIRKHLRACADFKRKGINAGWWVMKPDFRLPSEEELCKMISPEECCAYFSMLAAEQRLKDAGYCGEYLFPLQDDDSEDIQVKMEDEVKAAPWNTTRAFIRAMQGKCILQLTGPADPTGCGEGFSYIAVFNKPILTKDTEEAPAKKNVRGTNADLRKLSVKSAKEILNKFEVPDEEIKKLSRWEMIDVVRTLSNEKAKVGEDGMTFSRRRAFSIAEHQNRYKEECQRIFQLQNRVLSSVEVLSTDEDETSDGDSSDIEEIAKDIEIMLSSNATSSQLAFKKEERQREELKNMLTNESQEQESKQQKNEKNDEERPSPEQRQRLNNRKGRVLKIYRTFRDENGQKYTRVETVRNPAVIDLYVKIKKSNNEAIVKQIAALDEAQMKREKKKLQEQLGRIKRIEKRNQVYSKMKSSKSLPLSPTMPGPSNINTSIPMPILQCNNLSSPSAASHHPVSRPFPSNVRKLKIQSDLQWRCGACGNISPMRTNRDCPLCQSILTSDPNYAPMIDRDRADFEKQFHPNNQSLVTVEGTKVTLSTKLIKEAEELKLRSLLPEAVISARKRRIIEEDDYLKKPQRPAKRCRTDPVVVMETIFENILNEIRDLPDIQPFVLPVSAKAVPDYYNIIQRPMNLQIIRENLRQKKYQTREVFLTDVNQIVANSSLYNGSESYLTITAKKMLDTCVQRLGEKEDILMKLEKTINPLLDDDDQVALTFILDNVLNNKLKIMVEARPFLTPINEKLINDYYKVIKRPMDLETISRKVAEHKYHNRQEFIRDVEQIRDNSVQYNGTDSSYTMMAELLVKMCKEALNEYHNHLSYLENNISLTKQRTTEQTDTDSNWLNYEEENYAMGESKYPNTQVNSIHNQIGKLTVDDVNFVDTKGDIQAELCGINVHMKKKHGLEADLELSSEDEFMEATTVVAEVEELENYAALQSPVMSDYRKVTVDDSQQAADGEQ